jgi:hypothetical protein
MNLAKQYPEAFRRVVERAWKDEAFKAQLLTDPVTAVAQEGIFVPEIVRRCGITFKVVEDTEAVRHLVLPPPPADELSDLELAVVAGGKGGGGKNRAGGSSVGEAQVIDGYMIR